MEEMWNVLMRGECPVAELVCNHQSFSQTVENMFTLAFLVRDGRVQLLHNPDLGMIARKALTKAQRQQLQQQQQQQQQQAGSSRQAKAVEEQQQFVIALTQADWEDMIRVVRKEDCKMKHRQQEDVFESQAAPDGHVHRAHQGSRGPASAGVPGSQGPQAESQKPQGSPSSQDPPSQAPGTRARGLAAVKREGSANKRRRANGQ
ncbi:Nse4 C-terminal-domain-containing protein [Dunaliella salina]|nr:Nse4 C-terminal-domain-containing protein [Dunaliella salina]|eukprot:KAF5836390.1 Nse4 C-terminal-domain-containing protein [Dunaliella salina]